MTRPCHLPVPHRVFARRIARIAFGVVLLAGAAALVAADASGWFQPGPPPRLSAMQIIGYAWFAAIAAGAVAYASAAVRRLSLAPDALFVPSLVVPVAGVALILPLTLHLLFGLAIGMRAREFDDWVQLSLVVTGATHVAFAALCVARAHRLAGDRPALSTGKIFLITVGVSCVPFALLVLMPPTVVAITGLPILPLVYGMKPLIHRELDEIEAFPAQLPRAAIARRPH